VRDGPPAAEPRIARADPSRLDEAAAVLARAFAFDPGAVLVYPRAATRDRALRDWFAALAAGRATRCEVALTRAGRCLAAALWLDPVPVPAPPLPGLALVRSRLAVLRHPDALARMALAAPALARLERAARPPHAAVLLAIGVDPRDQRRGAGRALLRHALRRLDAAARPCYLETTRTAVLPFYAAHGFRVAGEVVTHGRLRTLALVRDPPGTG
jgi:ribosomal protein S18 acetylase RimI-like enzyme